MHENVHPNFALALLFKHLKWNAGKTYQMENQFVILNSFQCLLCEKDPVDLVLAVGIPM